MSGHKYREARTDPGPLQDPGGPPCSTLITSDEAYTQLCGAVESAIERLAEQSKVPPDVLLLENYHYLYMFLLKNKVESLDKFRKVVLQPGP